MTKQEYQSKIQFSDHSFVDEKEWYYIEPNFSFGNLNDILKQLDNKQLLKNNFNICDAGFGLGATMYGFYLESKEIKNVNFSFFGVEKYKKYIDYFNQNLKEYWNDITIYNEDIVDHDYSQYDLVYTYTPFQHEKDLLLLYQKIIDDLPSNGILLEYANGGLGFFDSMVTINRNNRNITKKIPFKGHYALIKK